MPVPLRACESIRGRIESVPLGRGLNICPSGSLPQVVRSLSSYSYPHLTCGWVCTCDSVQPGHPCAAGPRASPGHPQAPSAPC